MKVEQRREEDTQNQDTQQEQPVQDDTRQRVSRRRLLATGLGGGAVLALGMSGFALWMYEQRALRVIEQMNSGVSAVCWSPDGHSFIAGNNGGVVSVWGIDGQRIYSKQVFSNFSVSTLAWSPDGQYLAIGGDDTAHIWHARTGESFANYQFADRSFAWSHDGKWIASGGDYGLIQIWQPLSGYESYALQAYTGGEDVLLTINSIAWSPDNTQIATVGPNQGEVIALWNVTTGKAVALPFNVYVQNSILSRMNAIGWSPDGMHIAAGYADGHGTGNVALWSRQTQTKTWNYIGSAPAHVKTVHGIAWSPDSTRFASVGQDTKIQLWNMSYGLQMDISTSSKGLADSTSINTIAWSPNGTYLLAGDDAGQVLLWKVG